MKNSKKVLLGTKRTHLLCRIAIWAASSLGDKFSSWSISIVVVPVIFTWEVRVISGRWLWQDFSRTMEHDRNRSEMISNGFPSRRRWGRLTCVVLSFEIGRALSILNSIAEEIWIPIHTKATTVDRFTFSLDLCEQVESERNVFKPIHGYQQQLLWHVIEGGLRKGFLLQFSQFSSKRFGFFFDTRCVISLSTERIGFLWWTRSLFGLFSVMGLPAKGIWFDE